MPRGCWANFRYCHTDPAIGDWTYVLTTPAFTFKNTCQLPWSISLYIRWLLKHYQLINQSITPEAACQLENDETSIGAHPGDPGLAGTSMTTKITARRTSTDPVVASTAMSKCCGQISDQDYSLSTDYLQGSNYPRRRLKTIAWECASTRFSEVKAD